MSRAMGRNSVVRYAIWAQHSKVGPRWILLLSDLPRQLAAEELIIRQDVVRRNGQPCKFRLLPAGEQP